MIYGNIPYKILDGNKEAFCKLVSGNFGVGNTNWKWGCIYENEKDIFLKVYSDSFESLIRKVNERISEDFFPYDVEFYIEKTTRGKIVPYLK